MATRTRPLISFDRRASRRWRLASSCRRAPIFWRSARISTRRSAISRLNLPQGISIQRIADQPKVVDAAVFEFMRSFLEALVIVLAVSFVSLGWRTGIVVATSVPLVLAIVFIAMAFLGLDLQRITLGALIIALGLLVDDAIIAVEMMVVKMEQGWDRERAGAFAWTSTAFPMLTGTLVTAIGFPADRPGQFGGRRICRRHLLGGWRRAGRLVVRRRDFHPLSRGAALARRRAQGAPR